MDRVQCNTADVGFIVPYNAAQFPPKACCLSTQLTFSLYHFSEAHYLPFGAWEDYHNFTLLLGHHLLFERLIFPK
jgi:hypothetical protein